MKLLFPSLLKKHIVAIGLVLLSMVLAIHGPVATTNAQAANETRSFQELKDKTLEEVERRIQNYRETRERLTVDVNISKENPSAIVEKGESGLYVTKDEKGLDVKLKLASNLKEKVKGFTEKTIEQLSHLKEKVKNAQSMEDIQPLVKNIEAQHQLTQLADVQSKVTNAIETLTGVVDKMEVARDKLSSQIQLMRECLGGIKSGDSEINIKRENRNATISGSGPGCEDLNTSSVDAIADAESRMANIATMTSTVKNVLASAMSLLSTLVNSFNSLLSGLGNASGLGNLGNLGNTTNLSSLLSNNGGTGNINGLMGSFTAITSQLGIANGMSGNVQGLLGNLTSFINV